MQTKKHGKTFVPAKCRMLWALILTISISACASSPADVAIGCADPPELEPMTQEMRDRADDDVVTWTESTVSAIKDWGVTNCRRIRAHDERFQ